MSKKAKARKISALLKQLYPSPAIPLLHDDAYTLLIAVLLSAQCTDARVNTITPLLFKMANTPQKMVLLSISDIENIIRPCGLAPTKAKAIWHLSQQLLEKYQGTVPADFEALESLPGVGHKTASVVMSQAFKKPAFPVDTHIHRCAERWGLSNGKNVKTTEKDLKALFPKKDWNGLHLRIIYFAREFCTARGHKIAECPICSLVGAENKKITTEAL